MDQVKVYLAWLVKHHFWVLAGTTVIFGIVGWFLSANALADYYVKRKIKIESEFAKPRKIQDTPNHPNPSFEAGVAKLLDQKGTGLKARVLAAWNHCYNEQKNEVLVWPKEMGDDFQQVIVAVGDGEIPVDYRERFFNYVRNEFPKLLAIVDAQSFAELANERGGQRGRVDDAERPKKPTNYKVIWRVEDQRMLDEALDWPRAPSSKEMRYVQENLWVYNSLLRIIAKVNENATAHYNAKIKEIISVQIARPAAQEFQNGMAGGKLIPPQPIGQPATGPGGMAPVGAGMAGEGAGLRPSRTREAGGGRLGGQQAGGQLAFDSVQDEGRYVDAKGQPLTDPAAAPPEFKRMPVFMQLYMDQREISRLLVECANSRLPVEVKQLRVNPSYLRRPGRTDVTSVFAGSAKAGGGGQRGGGINVEGGGADRELNPYDMPVEIQGIIYIFNPPNRAKLAVAGQTASEADSTPINDAAPAEAAAKEPAAGAAAPVDKAPDDKAPDAGAAPPKAAPEAMPADAPARSVAPSAAPADGPARASE